MPHPQLLGWYYNSNYWVFRFLFQDIGGLNGGSETSQKSSEDNKKLFTKNKNVPTLQN